ncbi:SUMF1/EgtB/PvdO family nonheme iron enzyme [Hyalangium rubrum]|uniref:SUMF1/EgtB/PvdO family nonheme iron enzyme n=1 Tax=Hyalangium rubrum TaxID=3103134 RepID=A0ABU5GY82_9BACT|nr:SUMF1/EgtB/PvdO family nonheme iron enzyme [Hyalangium sp. s54d21]MDY7226163.1 SUMF1/EgtB/PvdO family nonheme iron enzyme [Hyalangium sp. s54d21]
MELDELPSYVAYLPLRDGHAIPVVDLSPESISACVKAAHRNPSAKLKHTTGLGAVAHALGFKGGFAGYRKAYPELQEFMERNGLYERRELITCKDAFAPIHLGRQQVAERFFASGRPLPLRLFTGWDFDWAAWEGPDQEHKEAFDLEFRRKSYNGLYVEAASWDVDLVAHLLGDALVEPADLEELPVQLYFANGDLGERSQAKVRAIRSMYRAFRERFLEPGRRGWVEVLPYNKHLVFLRGHGGAYDFVFREARGGLPPVPPFSKHLTLLQTPKAYLLQKSFSTFEYGRTGAWREREQHEAEVAFYKGGGTVKTYPGSKEILERYLSKTSRALTGPRQAEGFTTVQLEGDRHLLVSDPVTIGEFRRFLDETDWLRFRRRFQSDENIWEPANQDSAYLPVTVTYYDALAYAAWVERKRELPVRLPTIEEYRAIHPARKKRPDTEDAEDPRSNRFTHGHVRWLSSTADGTNEVAWRDVEAGFEPSLPRAVVQGIRFYLSASFGEWLHENHADGEVGAAAAVSTYDLSPIHGVPGRSLERDFMPAASWGRYRSCKIGFRLCFIGA